MSKVSQKLIDPQELHKTKISCFPKEINCQNGHFSRFLAEKCHLNLKFASFRLYDTSGNVSGKGKMLMLSVVLQQLS